MGKLVTFMTILIFIDILLLATGQLSLDSPSSLIINAIQDPSILRTSNLWTVLITGVSLLAVGAAVIAGIATRNSDIAIFITMGTTLALMIGDYLVIYNHLASINKPLAIMLFPITVLLAEE